MCSVFSLHNFAATCLQLLYIFQKDSLFSFLSV
uniref:Uncharacterized protein n=1 Tax=Rhizophora mucronata TaxID=61149 RepID=A0A2P2LT04_RHIMU